MKPTEYAHWSEDVRYLYDERIAILVEGTREPTTLEQTIAKVQARKAHAEEVSFKASEPFERTP